MKLPPELTSAEIDLLRSTTLLSREHSTRAAAAFYDELFRRNPDLRRLFAGDMAEQNRKFAATLSVAVHSLWDWTVFQPVLEALARRHLRYGVKAEHYDDVRGALIQTLISGGCRAEQIDAWRKTYDLLANHMLATAYPPSPEGGSGQGD